MRSFATSLTTLVLSISPVFLSASQCLAATPTPVPTPPPIRHIVGGIPLAQTVAVYDEVAYGYRASKLIGSSVYNDRNQIIGRIADIVVTRKDHVSYFIIAVGGFLGMGVKDIAIQASRVEYKGNHIVLAHATKKMLMDFPAFHFSR